MVHYITLLNGKQSANMRLYSLEGHSDLAGRPLLNSNPGVTVWSSQASFSLYFFLLDIVFKRLHGRVLYEACLPFSLYFSSEEKRNMILQCAVILPTASCLHIPHNYRFREHRGNVTQSKKLPEQRNFLLLICPILLLARRRGLVQRAPLVSIGLVWR